MPFHHAIFIYAGVERSFSMFKNIIIDRLAVSHTRLSNETYSCSTTRSFASRQTEKERAAWFPYIVRSNTIRSR